MTQIIKDALLRRDEAIQKATNDWLAACQGLADLIPESLRSFAVEHGWIKSDDWWKLPERLENMAIDGMAFQATDATNTHFVNIEEAQVAFAALNIAWAGFIHIEVDYKKWPRFEAILTPTDSAEG